jgi:hypothetical protein
METVRRCPCTHHLYYRGIDLGDIIQNHVRKA